MTFLQFVLKTYCALFHPLLQSTGTSTLLVAKQTRHLRLQMHPVYSCCWVTCTKQPPMTPPPPPDPPSPSHGSVRHHYSIKPSHKVLAEHFERKAADTHWRKKKQKKPLHKISGDKLPNATVTKENRPRWRYRLKAGFKQDSRVWINSHEQIF